MLDFLGAAYGRGSNLAEKRFALAGGGILTCPILTTGGYRTVIECQSVKALSNTGNGWSYKMTPAELAKKMNFILSIGRSTIRLRIVQGQDFQNCRIIWRRSLFLIRGRKKK